jgi:hypothetical protein
MARRDAIAARAAQGVSQSQRRPRDRFAQFTAPPPA